MYHDTVQCKGRHQRDGSAAGYEGSPLCVRLDTLEATEALRADSASPTPGEELRCQDTGRVKNWTEGQAYRVLIKTACKLCAGKERMQNECFLPQKKGR